MRAPLFVSVSVLLAVSCGCRNAPKADDRQNVRPVALPDLSRLEESVQAQMRERYAALAEKQKDPRAPAADLGTEYGEMGMLLMAAEFRDPAEASLLDAQVLAPGDRRWAYYLGHLYKTKGDMPNAIAAFERVLQSAPNDVPTMAWLGEAALDQGRLDAAESLFTRALSLQPRSIAARYGLGRTALAKQDYMRAAQNLEQALALDDKASIIHYPLAMAYRGLGDRHKAESHLQQRGTLQIQPDDPLRKALDELLAQRADLRDQRRRRGQQRPVARCRGISPKGRGPGPSAGVATSQAGHGAVLHRRPARRIRTVPGGRAAVADARHRALQPGCDARRGRRASAGNPVLLGRHPVRAGLSRRAPWTGQRIETTRTARAVTAAVPSRSCGWIPAPSKRASVMPRRSSASHDIGRLEISWPKRWIATRTRWHSRARPLACWPRRPTIAFAMAAARWPSRRCSQGRQPRSIELAETIAMTSAEVGQYADAVMWQQQAIEAAVQAGRRDLVERLTGNLALYQAHRPCRTPWRADEPIEFYSGSGRPAESPAREAVR